MCGITGIFNTNGTPADRDAVAKMTARIAHRGPDGDGIFADGPIGLGHRRLSIIDLESGSQPMRSADGNFTIVFNGEIYNYRELRAGLVQKNYPFKTHSDTEVILALYQSEGEKSFQKLAGMFAFAIWDSREQKLVLVRDRSGIKPFYYAQVDGQLVFASEIKAITAQLPQLKELDKTAVNFYFSRQYIGGAGTVFKKIKKVKPGYFLEISKNGKIREAAYWQLSPATRCKHGMEEAIERTDGLLAAAVKSHLVSDVPVGIFLSGGLDSSTILAYATEASERSMQTFSVGFGPHTAYNETHFARQLAEHFKTEHHEIQVAEKELLDTLPHIIQQMDQPLADYAVLPTYVMSRFARKHLKVVLSGEGADELFGGYKRYHFYSFFDRFGLSGFFKKKLPGSSVYGQTARQRLLNPDVFVEGASLPQEQKILSDKNGFTAAGAVNSMLHADLSNWLVDDLLMKVDKMGMLASLEARVPYLDHALVEYLASLDGKLKVSLWEKKRLLRAVAAKRLPKEVFTRPKHGFTVPVGEWLRGALKGVFREAVLEDAGNQEWFNLDFVEKQFAEHLSGKNHRLQLWAVLVFCLWKREQGV